MRAATNIAVILAVVATALAGVKEQSESRRLQYDIPRLERRRDLLERRLRAAEAAVAHSLSARSLLLEHERAAATAAATAAAAGFPAPTPEPVPSVAPLGESP